MAKNFVDRPIDYDTEDALRQSGEYVSIWRRLQGLTQGQVADRAGVSRGVVVRLEAGEPGTSMDTFFRVLGALHITAEITAALDPYRGPAGMTRIEEQLPQRVRRAAKGATSHRSRRQPPPTERVPGRPKVEESGERRWSASSCRPT